MCCLLSSDALGSCLSLSENCSNLRVRNTNCLVIIVYIVMLNEMYRLVKVYIVEILEDYDVLTKEIFHLHLTEVYID